MTEQDQIKTIAELDELVLTWEFSDFYNGSYYSQDNTQRSGRISSLAYLTSYDAIIPVIQKQNPVCRHTVCIQFADTYMQIKGVIGATPAQLCKALLRATGKWKD